VARLPKALLKRARPCAADMTDIPYHGRHEAEDDLVRRGRAKQGTTHFHSYATLCIIRKHKRYTLAITLFRRSDAALDALKRLLAQGERLGLRLKRLFLDRGFDNNAVVDYLSGQAFPTIMPLTIRGKQGGSRALLKGRTSYHTTYTRSSQRYGDRMLTVQIVCKYHQGRYRRQGVKHFAYILIGQLNLSPQQLFEEYRRRFGIETGYRLMNTMRARTTSKWVALRLFLVALALLLLNLWHYVKWQYLFVPRPGPRQLLHHLLPLARWRLLYCRVSSSAETVWQHRGSGCNYAGGHVLTALETGSRPHSSTITPILGCKFENWRVARTQRTNPPVRQPRTWT